MRSSSPRDAFTLLEITIVIAIIALLIGGVIVGQSMISAARVNGIGVDLTRYDGAVQTFRGRYKAWPGDMLNATSYWGAAHVTPATCTTTQGTPPQTCNGNGDQTIAYDATTYYEAFRAWQHMAIDGLLATNFSGVAGGGGTYHHVPGTNSPAGRIKNTGYGFGFIPLGTATLYNAWGNVIYYGGSNATTLPNSVALTPAEAYSIDGKIDDGLPASGIISTYNNTARSNCSSSDTAASAVYKMSYASAGCMLIFRMSSQSRQK